MNTILNDYDWEEYSKEELELAFPYYLDYMEKKELEPEVNSVDEVDEFNIAHVIYHAELEWYKKSN